jgi:putative transposase
VARSPGFGAPASVSPKRRPRIFNTDQGSQFTSEAFTGRLKAQRCGHRQDGCGRYLDNIFIERLWRSVKYDEVCLKDYQQYAEAQQGLGRHFSALQSRAARSRR